MISLAFVLAVSISCCAASVDFTYSTLYDIYDFVGKAETRVSKCNNGCLIFASTLGQEFDSATGFDPYAENLIIRDKTQNRNYSVVELSQNYDASTSAKTPLVITGASNIFVANVNAPGTDPSQIVLYVVEKSKEFAYAVYDAMNMKGVKLNPNSVATVMSADPFSLKSAKTGAPNGLKARLAGFENVRDGNGDACPRAFSIDTQNPFPGFNININGPIISMIFNERTSQQVDAIRTGLVTQQSMGTNGFFTSPGYNGCTKALSRGIQSFRSPIYEKTNTFLLTSNKDYRISIDTQPNLDAQNKVTVTDLSTNHPVVITGNKKVSLNFNKTKGVQVDFANLEGSQGFLMTHTDVPV